MVVNASVYEGLVAWMPDARQVQADLNFKPIADFDYGQYTKPWHGMLLHYYDDRQIKIFNGYEWSRWTAHNWQIPLTAVTLYVIMIPTLQYLIKEKISTKRFNIVWNILLSTFSLCGLLACAPVMINEFISNGSYFTICAPAPWYGGGVHGFFVAAFIYSKLAELVDTVLLILAKRPVILLHWWHHVTVLLYCWHSYTTQIATGMWFATMNYFVHTIMYAYFAATQTSLRKAVKPYAIYITLFQLIQMMVGIFVTLRAVIYQATGYDCRVNKTNSILGLTMYSSYFLLFFKLFLDNYVFSSSSSSSKTLQKKKLS